MRGKIVGVNTNLRFVVIDFYLSPLPQVGQLMSVYRKDAKVAEIKVSGPERNSKTVADIIVGEVQMGDEARRD